MEFSRIICHRIPSRCIKINGLVLPLCARCLGFYSSLIIGFILSLLFGIAHLFEKKEMLVLVIIFVSPLAIDGITQLFRFRESNNYLRLTTGLVAGFVCGIGGHYLLI